MLKDLEQRLKEIDKQIQEVESSQEEADLLYKKQLLSTKQELIDHAWSNMNAFDRVYLARHPKRQGTLTYVKALFRDIFEVQGDRLFREDGSIYCAIATFREQPVTVIAQRKGRTLEENLTCNFGMPNPEGYRKVQRVVAQAEKFNRPIITFIDTPGAYPGLEAEQRGQGEAIARCLAQFSGLTVPVIAIITGEGGSGGALAIGVANRVIMLENAIYSILSPEGFATILWKDGSRAAEAAEKMKLSAKELREFGVADYLVSEGVGGVMKNERYVLRQLDKILRFELNKYKKMSGSSIQRERYTKYRNMGNVLRG